jgi:acyl carrier protein
MTVLPSRADLIAELKAMILKECDLERDADSIPDDMVLVGEGLELDSLDALQISLAVKEKYGVRIEGGPDARRAFASVSALADFITAGKNAAA